MISFLPAWYTALCPSCSFAVALASDRRANENVMLLKYVSLLRFIIKTPLIKLINLFHIRQINDHDHYFSKLVGIIIAAVCNNTSYVAMISPMFNDI